MDVLEIFEILLNKKVDSEVSWRMKEEDSVLWQSNQIHTRTTYNFLSKYSLKQGLEDYIKYRKQNAN